MIDCRDVYPVHRQPNLPIGVSQAASTRDLPQGRIKSVRAGTSVSPHAYIFNPNPRFISA